jgi:hypothetical protein
MSAIPGMKIEVLRVPANLSDPPYSHLLPILDGLVANGNAPVNRAGFYMTRDGYRCDLTRSIDFGLLRRTFEFPPTIILSEELDSLFCKNSWVQIVGRNNKNWGSDAPLKEPDTFLFYPGNERYLRGDSKWTEQGKRNLFELVMSVPFIILLALFLAIWPLESWLRLGLFLISAIIVIALIIFSMFKFGRERRLAAKGRIVPAVVTGTRLTGKGSDTTIFEISFDVEDSHLSFEKYLDPGLAENLTGRNILVLFADNTNFLVL